MISQSQNNSIDLDLVDKIIALIPDVAWPAVIQAVVTNIVDNMPTMVVEKLTGTHDDFDKAEEIVLSYYNTEGRNKDLIIDAFKILGAENTVYLLDALQLDKYAEFCNAPTDKQIDAIDKQ